MDLILTFDSQPHDALPLNSDSHLSQRVCSPRKILVLRVQKWVPLSPVKEIPGSRCKSYLTG